MFSSVLIVLTATTVASAQERPTPSPSPSATAAPKAVRIRFLPPPLEGTISLGIYDSSGKLVRVLHREAELEEFEIGNDALGTTWDGKNDAGTAMPPGKYRARGYAVGEIKVDGVGFFFNDWVSDAESPHVRTVDNLKLVSETELALLVTLASGKTAFASCDLSGELSDKIETDRADERFLPDSYSVRVIDGKLSFKRASGWEAVAWPDLLAPQSAATGKDGTVWVIDRAEKEGERLALKQFSSEGNVLREMAFAASEPQPKIVAASTVTDRIFLLEQNAALQRLRGLTLVATNAPADPSQTPVSDWKVEFEKRITAHQRFAIVGGQPVVGPDPAASDFVKVKLRTNPLEKDRSATVEVAVGYDAEGSFLKTADGLPLQTVSETPYLTTVLIAPINDKSIDVFQDDEAVVEQFRVTALDQMMAFDCGEFELK